MHAMSEIGVCRSGDLRGLGRRRQGLPDWAGCVSHQHGRLRGSRERNRRREGIVVLEFILWTPVFILLLFAAIEFALILTSIQHVKSASRAGAKVAAELPTAGLASGNDADNITLVNNAVATVLSSVGMSPCEVILEFNPTCDGITPGTKQAGSCAGCFAPTEPLPNGSVIPGGTVRVTVCVDVEQMTPDMLALFGFSVQGRTARVSTLLPYENCE
jgi:Flp pilus assembly protein TadG